MNSTDYAHHTRLRIALYLAACGYGPLDVPALREAGRNAGMNGAEMSANAAGTSHDAKGTACLLFVRQLIEQPGSPPTSAMLRTMEHAGFTTGEIRQVVTQVRMNTALARGESTLAASEIDNCEPADSRPEAAD